MSIKINGTEITAINVNGTAVETVRVRASASSEYVVVFTAATSEYLEFVCNYTDVPNSTNSSQNIAEICPSNESYFLDKISNKFFKDTSPKSYLVLSDSLNADLGSVETDDQERWIELFASETGIGGKISTSILTEYPDLLKFPVIGLDITDNFFSASVPKYVTIDFMNLKLDLGEETILHLLGNSSYTYIAQGNIYKKQAGIIDHAFYGYDPNNVVAQGEQPSTIELPTNILENFESDLSSSNFICMPISIRDANVEMYGTDNSGWRGVAVTEAVSTMSSLMSEFMGYTSQFPSLRIFVPILCDDVTNENLAKLTQLGELIQAQVADYGVGDTQIQLGIEKYAGAVDEVQQLVTGDSYKCLVKQVPFGTNTSLGYKKNYLRDLCNSMCAALGALDNEGYFLIVDDQENEVIKRAMYANESNHIYFAEWMNILIENIELPCYTLCNESIAAPYTVGRAFDGTVFLGVIPTLQMIAKNEPENYTQFLSKYPNTDGIPTDGITYVFPEHLFGCYYG